jgi:hypothetical protein
MTEDEFAIAPEQPYGARHSEIPFKLALRDD